MNDTHSTSKCRFQAVSADSTTLDYLLLSFEFYVYKIDIEIDSTSSSAAISI